MRYSYPLFILCALFFVISCNEPTDGPGGENPDTPSEQAEPMGEEEPMGDEEMVEAEGSNPKDAITLDSANVWSCNFQNYMSGGISSTQWDNIKADGFFIPEDDVTQLTSLTNVSNLRAYLGLRNDTLKLMFVGVDGSGNDILTLITDFTSPCPPDCGTNKQITTCAD